MGQLAVVSVIVAVSAAAAAWMLMPGAWRNRIVRRCAALPGQAAVPRALRGWAQRRIARQSTSGTCGSCSAAAAHEVRK